MTGIPSIDKPWKKYYSEEDINIEVPEMSLMQFLLERNRDHHELPALRYLGKRFTYQEMFDIIDQASRYLQSLGVKEKDYVALALPLIPETIFLMYGLDQIGAVANLIDPRVPADRMRYYINLASVKVGFVIASYSDTMIAAAPQSTLEKIIPISPVASLSVEEQKVFLREKYSLSERTKLYTAELKTRQRLAKANRKLKTHSNCEILPFEPKKWAQLPGTQVADYQNGKASVVEYTSGTTGIPKGLELSASGMNVTAAEITQVNRTTPGETILGIMPPFISYGAVTGIHMSLSAGCELILIPAFSVGIFAQLIKEHKPNNIICVPSMFEHVMDSDLLANEDLSFLKRLIFGGDRTMPEYEERVNVWLKEHKADIRLIKGGGMAEYSSCAFETPYDETKKPGVYGIPLPLVDAKIMKDEHTECGYGEIGEIYISSPQQMCGYINNQKETDAFFFTDESGKKWGRSGDLGWIDQDGLFTLSSRKKQMIIRPDGHNVFPSEIENVIVSCGEVKDCVVIGVPDQHAVIGEYPVAFIELKAEWTASCQATLKKIIAKVEKNIPLRDRPLNDSGYILTNIPYTGEGKIDRNQLLRSLAASHSQGIKK